MMKKKNSDNDGHHHKDDRRIDDVDELSNPRRQSIPIKCRYEHVSQTPNKCDEPTKRDKHVQGVME